MEDFAILLKTWETLGRKNAFFSVLTEAKYHKHLINDAAIEDLYETGNTDIDFVQTLLEKHGSTLVHKTVLEFGCGVGRMTKAALKAGAKVTGVDISSPHLDIAKKYAPHAQYHLITTPQSLQTVAEHPDIIYSFIVLQHIRPHLMTEYLEKLLDLLKPDGIAVLHIPYDIPDCCNVDNETNFFLEMHFIPESVIGYTIDKCGCQLLEKNEDRDMCGSNIKNAVYVIQRVM